MGFHPISSSLHLYLLHSQFHNYGLGECEMCYGPIKFLDAPPILLFFLLYPSVCPLLVCVVNCVKVFPVVEGKLNVHLVPHSRDDVGWLKTIDQYYVGSNYTIQNACVENVLDSVIESLRRDPNSKFAFAEQAFFQRWWTTQSVEIQEEVKRLVYAGQLEFVNGGWCYA